LTKRIIDLEEATELNGVIVAPDQEKAYDKIEHEHLWRALQSFNIPDEFINTTKALYSDAYTSVVINRTREAHLRVTPKLGDLRPKFYDFRLRN
jgi:hypothetical protein